MFCCPLNYSRSRRNDRAYQAHCRLWNDRYFSGMKYEVEMLLHDEYGDECFAVRIKKH